MTGIVGVDRPSGDGRIWCPAPGIRQVVPATKRLCAATVKRLRRRPGFRGGGGRRSDDRRSKVVNINSAGQLKVVLMKPVKFDEDANTIADHLMEKRTVVMNMENTDPDIARRLLDFVSGVAYATSGNVKRVAAKTYIVTPYSVDLMGDLIDGLENSGLYM